MEERKRGREEEWKRGRVEERKSGRVEEWKTFLPQTLQGVDILANLSTEHTYQVFMPDFFGGEPAEREHGKFFSCRVGLQIFVDDCYSEYPLVTPEQQET